MFINRAGINKNIINVNNGKMTEKIENIIHNILEFTWSILKTKMHHIPLIMTKRSGESSFIPILLTNLNLPKSRFHIKLGEYYSSTQSMNQIIFFLGMGYLIHSKTLFKGL